MIKFLKIVLPVLVVGNSLFSNIKESYADDNHLDLYIKSISSENFIYTDDDSLINSQFISDSIQLTTRTVIGNPSLISYSNGKVFIFSETKLQRESVLTLSELEVGNLDSEILFRSIEPSIWKNPSVVSVSSMDERYYIADAAIGAVISFSDQGPSNISKFPPEMLRFDREEGRATSLKGVSALQYLKENNILIAADQKSNAIRFLDLDMNSQIEYENSLATDGEAGHWLEFAVMPKRKIFLRAETSLEISKSWLRVGRYSLDDFDIEYIYSGELDRFFYKPWRDSSLDPRKSAIRVTPSYDGEHFALHSSMSSKIVIYRLTDHFLERVGVFDAKQEVPYLAFVKTKYDVPSIVLNDRGKPLIVTNLAFPSSLDERGDEDVRDAQRALATYLGKRGELEEIFFVDGRLGRLTSNLYDKFASIREGFKPGNSKLGRTDLVLEELAQIGAHVMQVKNPESLIIRFDMSSENVPESLQASDLQRAEIIDLAEKIDSFSLSNEQWIGALKAPLFVEAIPAQQSVCSVNRDLEENLLGWMKKINEDDVLITCRRSEKNSRYPILVARYQKHLDHSRLIPSDSGYYINCDGTKAVYEHESIYAVVPDGVREACDLTRN